jgi:dehydrodolichyl diphosphate syntase complex subunit NUS1
MEDVADLVAWSVCAQIPVLSVYEQSGKLISSHMPFQLLVLTIIPKQGILKSDLQTLHKIITKKLSTSHDDTRQEKQQQPRICLLSSDKGAYFPYAEMDNEKTSIPSSLKLFLLSSADGREALADLIKPLAVAYLDGQLSLEDISTELIDGNIRNISSGTYDSHPRNMIMGKKEQVLRSISNPDPDLLLVFSSKLKLAGYPPWQLQSTEIFYAGKKTKRSYYSKYLKGLKMFASSVQRHGR